LKSKFLNNLLSRQFRKPSGPLGYYALNFMKKNNQDYIAKVCGMLDPQDTDSILEIGCGAGHALAAIAERSRHCAIDAIDFSPFMIKKAEKTRKGCPNPGRIVLLSDDFCDCDFTGKSYNKIFAINVVYFWRELPAVFAKILRLLRPEGVFILFMSGPERLNQVSFALNDVFIKRTLDQVASALLQAGFREVGHETVVKMGCDTYYICARK
jgi:SAM-dependent methyltransferase